MENNTQLNLIVLHRLDCVFFVQSSICIVTSLLLLTLLLTRHHLRTRTRHMFAVNLQTVHTLLCVNCIVERAVPRVVPRALTSIFLMQMFLSLILMSGDRYMSIKNPFLHATMTTKHALVLIGCSWLCTSVFGCIVILCQSSPANSGKLAMTLLIVAAMTLAVSNIKIFLIARQHARAIQRQCPGGAENKRVLKSAYVTVAIVLSFIILWSPVLVFHIMTYTGTVNFVLLKLAIQSSCLEAMVDPILYVCFNRDVKKQIRGLCCKKRIDSELTLHSKVA